MRITLILLLAATVASPARGQAQDHDPSRLFVEDGMPFALRPSEVSNPAFDAFRSVALPKPVLNVKLFPTGLRLGGFGHRGRHRLDPRGRFEHRPWVLRGRARPGIFIGHNRNRDGRNHSPWSPHWRGSPERCRGSPLASFRTVRRRDGVFTWQPSNGWRGRPRFVVGDPCSGHRASRGVTSPP